MICMQDMRLLIILPVLVHQRKFYDDLKTNGSNRKTGWTTICTF